MANPLISIIIPVYNVEEFLHTCIKSVLGQDYCNIEIILIDDGSTDGSNKICDYYAIIDKRVKVIHKENSGQSDARNLGLDLCKGEYISFVDSDDWISKTYISDMFYSIIKYNSDISISQYQNVWGNCQFEYSKNVKCFEKTYTSIEAIEDLLYLKTFDNSPCAKLYKKNLFNSLRFTSGIIYEDLDICYKIFSRSKSISYINKVNYFYRRRKGSTMTQSFNATKMQLLNVSDEMLSFIKKEYPSLEKAAICRVLSANFHLYLHLPKNDKFIYEKKLLECNIKKYRFIVLFDTKARVKTRIASLISYVGFNSVKVMANLIKRT